MNKILVIDDSSVQTEFLCSVFKEDYEVTVCNTAEEGLVEATRGGYSLILLDVVMPDIDGFDLLKELKNTESTRYIPVILLTSLIDTQYEERGLLLGAVDYVTKPVSPIIIRARVRTHVQLYQYQTTYKKQALVDDLTGVANRRRYDAESISKWQEAVRFQLPFSVCMMDIDKFKMYNDTFGHPAGDKVLTAVAQEAASHFRRATDLFARYGGEEFVAVFVGNDGPSAFKLLKSIRQAVEDLHIPHSPEVGPWVTVSIGGVSLVPKAGESYETYLKLADTMLYDAKRYGRNQVVWCNDNKEQWREK